MNTWPLQDAKARFSELVTQAQKNGPQFVSRRGEDAVVVIAVEDYRRMARRGGKDNLVAFFRNSPLRGLPSHIFKRDSDKGRNIEL